uniref:Uncharacterized protein n=1 Tax=Hanusia phi TaxID=3032 RepID=A0A7S0F4D5_9CRYP|mmetsp:Transcript_36356/g.81975  ORF Transcript_36356/g.81975 Transcript_36356/m.81975 type:complete len:714 (+) Transcript_36356:281-2422(+)
MSMESITQNAIDALQRLERCEKRERLDLNLPAANPRTIKPVFKCEQSDCDEDAVKLLKDYLRAAGQQPAGSQAMIELVQDVLQTGAGQPLSTAGKRKTKRAESSVGVEVTRAEQLPSRLAPSCGFMANGNVRQDGYDECRLVMNRIVAEGEKVEQGLLAGLCGMTPGSAQYIALKEKAAMRKLKAVLKATEGAIIEKTCQHQEDIDMIASLKSKVRDYQSTILASVPDIRLAADAWIRNVESLRRDRDRMRNDHTSQRTDLEKKVLELHARLEAAENKAQEELKRNETFAKSLASSAVRQKELSIELNMVKGELQETRKDKERLAQLVEKLSKECEEETRRADSFSDALDRLRGILNRMRSDVVEQREADTALRVLVSWLRLTNHSKCEQHAQHVLELEEEGRRLLSEEKMMFMRTLEEERQRLQDEIKGLNQVLKHEREERLQEWEELSKRRAADAAAREEDRKQREEDKSLIAELQGQVKCFQQELSQQDWHNQQSLMARDKILHQQSNMTSKISMIERLVASVETSIRKLEAPPRPVSRQCKMVEDVSRCALSLSQEARSLLEERDVFAKEILSPPRAHNRSARSSQLPSTTRVRQLEQQKAEPAKSNTELVADRDRQYTESAESAAYRKDPVEAQECLLSLMESNLNVPQSPPTQGVREPGNKQVRLQVTPSKKEEGYSSLKDAEERFLEMALEKARKRASLIEHMMDY